MSLRLRFTLLAAATVTVTTLVLGGALYAVFARQQQTQLDDRLHSLATRSRVLERTGPGVIRTLGRPNGDPAFVLLLDPSGSVGYRSPNADQLDLSVPADVRQAAAGGSEQLLTLSSGGQDYRVVVTAAPLLRPPPTDTAPGVAATAASPVPTPAALTTAGGSVLVTGQSTQAIDDALRPLRFLLAGAGGLSLLLGALGGWLVARRALRPVTELSIAVDRIGHGGDLARRLPPPSSRDEVATLTENFNASLDRIESAYRELEESLDRQRRFVADASHELRTPLTTLRSDVELLRRHPGMSRDDRAMLVERSLLEVQRMSRLAADLLTLARGDAGALTVAALDWDSALRDAADDVVRLCAPRRVTVELAPLGAGAADADAVARIVRVLAENVARHTPETTPVTMTASRDGEELVVSVADRGPGVDPALLPGIFDRFVRGDVARSGPGTGLGLAIARALAEGHGGRITASAVEPHGLRVTVRLPGRYDPSAQADGPVNAVQVPAPAAGAVQGHQ